MTTSDPTSAGLRDRVEDAARSFARAARRRVELLRRDVSVENAHTPPLKYIFGEVGAYAEPVRRLFRDELPIEKSATPRTILLLPGFATSAWRMKYLAEQLERAGHKVKRWGLGYNFGPTPENFDFLSRRLCSVRERYDRKVVLVGWSLGGVFAREIAKRQPDCVEKVITLGSPFGHTPYSNNLWHVYEMVAGHAVDAPPVDVDTHEKPPVETVAFWSPRDGVVSRRAATGLPAERDRVVALRCSHMGFCNSPEVVQALIAELERR
ncbi:esterase/lipase family protein [Aurantiacibacter spongiae]|uniref:Alpha/beta fold hydrolase n=1 Tax=Aurantiacibacter spongiae TaxID=2488860 RepID=A0A3N5CT01_9SPHN|nr:alpha/beta fold hydrolase [Aurantiacibacter spongiae]RPF72303.1 alpha/beta fold hydrolase [Aurantiacibacter spongiae]